MRCSSVQVFEFLVRECFGIVNKRSDVVGEEWWNNGSYCCCHCYCLLLSVFFWHSDNFYLEDKKWQTPLGQ